MKRRGADRKRLAAVHMGMVKVVKVKWVLL
jgi:hypothetical protein